MRKKRIIQVRKTQTTVRTWKNLGPISSDFQVEKITSVKIGFFFSEKRTHNLRTLGQRFISDSDYMALQVSRDLFYAGQHLYDV